MHGIVFPVSNSKKFNVMLPVGNPIAGWFTSTSLVYQGSKTLSEKIFHHVSIQRGPFLTKMLGLVGKKRGGERERQKGKESWLIYHIVPKGTITLNTHGIQRACEKAFPEGCICDSRTNLLPLLGGK